MTPNQSYENMRKAAAKIIAEIRKHGKVHMPTLLLDPHAKKALAELQYTGAMRSTGEGSVESFQNFELAPNKDVASGWADLFVNRQVKPGKAHYTPAPFVLFG